jgi:hypothetical protein
LQKWGASDRALFLCNPHLPEGDRNLHFPFMTQSTDFVEHPCYLVCVKEILCVDYPFSRFPALFF